MGETTDKMHGAANKAAGSVKEGIGKLTGDEKLQAEGKMQQVKGHAQEAKGEVKGAVKKGIDNL
jgi:uncharacterized protein YjbJ (UPF0337 family)